MAQDPNTPAAPAAKPADGAAPAMDAAQLKTMLGLPEAATDADLIGALVELVSNLQQKYEALLQDTVALEDKVANRDLEDFKDVIAEDAKEFWKNQLLTNRDGCLAVLGGLRSVKTAAATAAPKPADPASVVPLRNRLADRPRSVADLAAEPVLADAARAVKIRNRAHELRAAERLPWSAAFARAEKEMN